MDNVRKINNSIQEILLGWPDRGFDGQDMQMVDIARSFAASY
jgi:hypothetical protein